MNWIRKASIVMLAIFLIASAAWASGKKDTDTGVEAGATEEPVKEEIAKYKEAPVLAAKVAKGELPPVQDRLPIEPKITNEMPPEFLDYEIGKYGGAIRIVTTTPEYDPDVFIMQNEPLVNTPGILGETVTPNILKEYEVSPDKKQFTFYMREGLKWSDGNPVTTGDVAFAIEDVIMNEQLTPSVPAWLRSAARADGTPMELVVVDDFTFRLKFDQPYGGFLINLAIQGWRGYTDLLKPKHYLEQFHVEYTPLDKLEPLIKEEKFEPGEWWKLFQRKDISNWNSTRNIAMGFPSLCPWILVEREGNVGIFERNPYYFKVDSAGNQLPYIDTVESYLVQNNEMIVMKIIAGEVDFLRSYLTLTDMPIIKENEDKGGYNVVLSDNCVTSSNLILNLTHTDPIWREVVMDLRFRKAINYAIDLENVANTIYLGPGLAKPSDMIENRYDPDEANRLLDEMGLKKGPDGMRLGPDGKKFEVPFEVQPIFSDVVPATELYVEMLKEIGLDATMKQLESSLWWTRNAANELKASVMYSVSPLWYYNDIAQAWWAPLWNMWRNSGGAQGEEPPEGIKTLFGLMDQMISEEPETGVKIFEEVKREIKNNLWYIPPFEHVKQPLVYSKKLGNIGDEGFSIGWNYAAEQFYYK